ncbi:hypothetical protein Hanom_Chr14g01274981 [Helianthus anomalus]
MMDWLSRSRISYAVQANPTIYNIHIEEFWKSAKVKTIDKVNSITVTVRNKQVIRTEERIRHALSLGDNSRDPLRMKKGFRRI